MTAERRDIRWNLIIAGISLILFYWLADAFVDSRSSKGEPFLHELLHPDFGELLINLIVYAILLGLLWRSWRQADISDRLTASLEDALSELALEKARSEAFLAASPDAVSVQDTDLRILYQNAAHKEMMGDHKGEYCYAAYQHRPTVCEGCHLVQSFGDGLPHRREVRAEKGGETIHAEIFSAPVRNHAGQIIAGIESVRNISDRKRAEQEISQLNSDLRQKTTELQVTNRELEAFSYSLTHDLRTPLTGIYLASQTVVEIYGDKLDETGTSMLQAICQSCERMEELIESMLMLFKVTSTDVTWEEVDLSAMANEIKSDIRLRDPERSAEWLVEEGLTVRADYHLVRILLENLLGNAWKYSARNGQARIEFGQELTDGETLFFVRDNGIGFDMEAAAEIFKPFQRLQNSRGFPGTGIGLATAHRIVDRHGGRIWAEGKTGVGATFYFSLSQPAA